MRKSLLFAQRLNDSIDRELNERAERHQDVIRRHKAAQTTAAAIARAAAAPGAAAAAAAPGQPLVLLAQGDSWFDYPLGGTLPGIDHTDVIAQLSAMGNPAPVILSVAHLGQTTVKELGLEKQQEMLKQLQDADNWLNGKPDAILFSGGGNDIAGDAFCIYLDVAGGTSTGLDRTRFDKELDSIEASYLDLFEFRDRFAAGVPIFAHSYDFPIPNGTKAACLGPWLKPAFDYCGWNVAQGTGIIKQALTLFKARVSALEANAANNFHLVPTQGTLDPNTEWANELHPTPAGFKRIAQLFLAELRKRFPGRV